ncbi:MAG: o-succinylbenzoate synthase [Actinomycetota bacterium]|nr:o-succinylbenzoate synthase [Actinomycetota bacterium]
MPSTDARPAGTRLVGVELREVKLPLVEAFVTSTGTETDREALLVRAVTPLGEGWGECVAGSAPHYSAEYAAEAREVITRFLLPRLAAGGWSTAEEVAGALAGVKGHPMAKAALESAILDAELRAAGVPLATHLGGVRRRVPAGVAVGITASVGELVDLVEGYLGSGYRRVKLKIRPGWDVVPVAAVRERFGDVALQVDANGAYTLADTDALAALDPFELLLVEQPLADDDLVGHAQLARRIRTPICLDESITSSGSAAAAIALGSCSVVNLKPGRVGGLLEARRVHDLCLAHQVPVWCGGMLETGVGRAANVALATLAGFTLPGDLSASERYFATDITPPFVLDDGHLDVPRGPGIGVDPLPEVLRRLTVRSEWVRL